MNVGEYGNFIRLNVGEDISSRQNILILISPSPVFKKIVIGTENGLSVPNQNITTPGGDFLANQYVEYQIKKGDIFISGVWRVKLSSESQDGTENKISDTESTFQVLP